MASSASAGAIDALLDRVGKLDNPFEITLPDGTRRTLGEGAPQFTVSLNNEQAVKALKSLDEGNISEAFLRGDLDLDGDMIAPFSLRASLNDRHPLVAAWRFVQPMLFGQVYTNSQAIASHYDLDPDLFLSFLDPEEPAYSQGVYSNDDESLGTALARKFDYAIARCGIGKHARVLEIGPGWGAFARHALDAGADFTGITISKVSQTFIEDRLQDFRDRSRIELVDLYRYEPNEKFDAIVIMGVIEHLPDYARVLKKFDALLKPGGRIFLDGSAARKKYELSTFMVRHIYPGNHSFLVLDDFLGKMNRSPFEMLECFNDSHSYFLTFRQWAQNLDANRDRIIDRFGEFEFRKFRLYLWGAAYEFVSRNLECYRMILHKPG
jgi:cyclopropane-fatty-acyl-phospholipid synthase